MILDLRDVRITRGQGAQRYSLVVEQLCLAAGQQYALVGPSGCGKSTLLDLLALVAAPQQAAHFRFCDADIVRLWQDKRHDTLADLRSRHLGYVLQTGGLLGFASVQANINLPRALLGLPDDGSVERLAERLDITEHLGKKPAQLSVGQRQRASCARALAHAPQLLLADEPTASLDPINAERVMQLLLAQSGELGATRVVATHDERLARRCGLPLLHLAMARDADGGVTARVVQP
ncbi:ABC transporter ATP-binding protein [Pseudomonas silvicola]|nr:ABC transporter ATP-binding protein [Pseudomonas silvicola]